MCYVPLSSILNILSIYRHSPLQIFKYFEIRQFKSEYVMFIAICHLKSLCILPFDTSHLNVQYIAIRQFKSEFAMYVCMYVYRLSPLQIFVYIAIPQFKSEYAMHVMYVFCLSPLQIFVYIAIPQLKSEYAM